MASKTAWKPAVCIFSPHESKSFVCQPLKPGQNAQVELKKLMESADNDGNIRARRVRR